MCLVWRESTALLVAPRPACQRQRLHVYIHDVASAGVQIPKRVHRILHYRNVRLPLAHKPHEWKLRFCVALDIADIQIQKADVANAQDLGRAADLWFGFGAREGDRGICSSACANMPRDRPAALHDLHAECGEHHQTSGIGHTFSFSGWISAAAAAD